MVNRNKTKLCEDESKFAHDESEYTEEEEEDDNQSISKKDTKKRKGKKKILRMSKEEFEALKNKSLAHLTDFITLNVRGKLFTVKKSVLKQPIADEVNHFFFNLVQLVESNASIEKDSQGNVFLDHDPHAFELLLKYLNSHLNDHFLHLLSCSYQEYEWLIHECQMCHLTGLEKKLKNVDFTPGDKKGYFYEIQQEEVSSSLTSFPYSINQVQESIQLLNHISTWFKQNEQTPISGNEPQEKLDADNFIPHKKTLACTIQKRVVFFDRKECKDSLIYSLVSSFPIARTPSDVVLNHNYFEIYVHFNKQKKPFVDQNQENLIVLGVCPQKSVQFGPCSINLDTSKPQWKNQLIQIQSQCCEWGAVCIVSNMNDPKTSSHLCIYTSGILLNFENGLSSWENLSSFYFGIQYDFKTQEISFYINKKRLAVGFKIPVLVHYPLRYTCVLAGNTNVYCNMNAKL